MSASQDHLREMRQIIFKEVTGAGICDDIAESAMLIASELVGNAVRMCGAWTPVVVQVFPRRDHVRILVHDPEPLTLPRRGSRTPDNLAAESGRGLWILDALAPGWIVETTPSGKQITCILPISSSRLGNAGDQGPSVDQTC
ncbi:ATP-binding protein [Streptomyces sp. NPDC055085]